VFIILVVILADSVLIGMLARQTISSIAKLLSTCPVSRIVPQTERVALF